MSRAWILISVLAASSCAELPEVTPGVCGNLAVEPGEDCEANSEGLTCVQCRFVCTPAEAHPACPAGWGCSTDGICAHGNAAFVATAPTPARFPGTLATANLVGDTSDELVLTDPVEMGLSRVSGPGRTIIIDEVQGLGGDVIAVGDLTGDAYDELVRTIAPSDARTQLFALRGQADDKLAIVPALSPLGSTPPDVTPRFGFLSDADQTPVLAWKDGRTVSARVGRHQGTATDVSGDDLLPIVMGAVIPPPTAQGSTLQAITAAQGGTIVFVVGLANPGAPTEGLLARQLPFPQGEIVDVRVADIDLDGRVEVVVGTATTLYAYTGNFLLMHTWSPLGDVATALRPGECVEGPGAVPLAWGDLDIDGDTDYVTRFGLMLGDGSTTCLERGLGSSNLTHAAMLDVDNDGQLDVATVVAGARSVTFLRARRGGFVVDVIRTTDPVLEILGADLDANNYKDLVVATAAPGDEHTRISFLQGSSLGFASDPIPVVEIPTVLAILTVPRTQSDELAVAGLVNGKVYGSYIGIATAAAIAFSQVGIDGGTVESLAIGDAHGDGADDDLYVIVKQPDLPDALHLLGNQRSYLTTIDGTLSIEGGELAGPLQLLDLTGDGIDDAVMASGDTVSLWDPVGTWMELGVSATALRTVIRGSTDCLAVSDAAGIWLLCGSQSTPIGAEPALAMVGVHADEDSDEEMAVVFADRVSVFDVTEGRWTVEVPIDLAGPAVHVAAPDLDGDGVMDLAVVSAAASSSEGRLQILWGVAGRGVL